MPDPNGVGSRMLFAYRVMHTLGSVNVLQQVTLDARSHHRATSSIHPGLPVTQPAVRERHAGGRDRHW